MITRIAKSTLATLERIERRLDRIDQRIDWVEANQRSDFRWLLGLILAGNATLLGVMAHGFHWI